MSASSANLLNNFNLKSNELKLLKLKSTLVKYSENFGTLSSLYLMNSKDSIGRKYIFGIFENDNLD